MRFISCFSAKILFAKKYIAPQKTIMRITKQVLRIAFVIERTFRFFFFIGFTPLFRIEHIISYCVDFCHPKETNWTAFFINERRFPVAGQSADWSFLCHEKEVCKWQMIRKTFPM